MSTTVSTSASWYRVGAKNSMDRSLGYDGYPLVGRFKFRTPAQGATQLQFASDKYELFGGDYAYQDYGFQFLVTADSTGHESRCGTGIGSQAGRTGDSLTGSINVQLMPEQDYYLWIWPRTDGYYRMEPGEIRVTLEGVYGTPSTISAADGCFGGQISVTLTVSTPGAVHDLSVACAGITETLLTQSSAGSCVWEPEIERYAAQLPDQAGAQAVFTCRTYYGGNCVGSTTATINLSFAPGSLPPVLTAGWASVAADNSDTAAAGIGLFVQGFSRALVRFDESKVACRLGASIAGFRIHCEGNTVSQAPYVTQVLTEDCRILCTVIDSRGQEAEEQLSVTVEPYSEPRLTETAVFRCDSEGNAAEDGAYFSAAARAIYAAVGGQNSVSLSAAHKQRDASAFGEEERLQNGLARVIGTISPDRSYEVRLRAEDTLGGRADLTITLPTQSWAMKFRPDGMGVGFGKAPEHDRCIELPAGWVIRIGDRILDGS